MKRKKAITIVTLFAAGFALSLAIIAAITALSMRSGVIKDRDGNFYTAKNILIAGDIIICTRGESFQNKSDALAESQQKRTLSLTSMKKIELIDFADEETQEETTPELASWQGELKDYIGRYTINAAGNDGELHLRAKDGAVYGTIRFPDWAKGKTEYLKNVRIANGKITFTRSVTTRDEQSRLGASSFFVQRYRGEYFHSGRTIKGEYIVNGGKKPWDARKR